MFALILRIAKEVVGESAVGTVVPIPIPPLPIPPLPIPSTPLAPATTPYSYSPYLADDVAYFTDDELSYDLWQRFRPLYVEHKSRDVYRFFIKDLVTRFRLEVNHCIREEIHEDVHFYYDEDTVRADECFNFMTSVLRFYLETKYDCAYVLNAAISCLYNNLRCNAIYETAYALLDYEIGAKAREQIYYYISKIESLYEYMKISLPSDDIFEKCFVELEHISDSKILSYACLGPVVFANHDPFSFDFDTNEMGKYLLDYDERASTYISDTLHADDHDPFVIGDLNWYLEIEEDVRMTPWQLINNGGPIGYRLPPVPEDTPPAPKRVRPDTEDVPVGNLPTEDDVLNGD